MSSLESEPVPVRLSARCVGGIEETTVEFEPGVTVLEGRNATNRTSLLQAVKAACGSRNVSVKSDADAGEVTLTVGEETYHRTLRSEAGTVVTEGDAYLDDPELAELFAFLLENNEARQSVTRGTDLREIIVRPIDTTTIQTEISRLESRKDDIDETLAELDDLENRLPFLEEDRTQTQSEVEAKRGELDEIKARIDAAETDVEDERADQRAVDETFSELQELRNDLETVRYDIETERESLRALRRERESLETDLADLPDPADTDIDDIDSEIDSLRSERQQLERKVTELNTVVQFNEEMLEESKPHLRHALEDADGGERPGSVTDQLLDGDDSVTCWTCGSPVDGDKIAATLDLLRSVRSETATRMDEVADSIEELETERRQLEDRRKRRSEIETRIQRIEDEEADHEATIESFEERRATLEDDVQRVRDELEELRTESQNEVLELHERANELEFELGRLQSQLDSLNTEIEEIEARLDERESLQTERERVTADLQDYRTRIETIQSEAVEAFNEHMETVIDLLEYENIGRVWIERTEAEVGQGRGKRRQPAFDLHVVRNPEDGAAYEDVVDNLSESEREMIGLVFALAGFLVHDVGESCPFILLDSLEAFDSERIARLVSYLTDHSDYLVVALLPEDAQALDAEYQRVEEI